MYSKMLPGKMPVISALHSFYLFRGRRIIIIQTNTGGFAKKKATHRTTKYIQQNNIMSTRNSV